METQTTINDKTVQTPIVIEPIIAIPILSGTINYII